MSAVVPPPVSWPQKASVVQKTGHVVAEAVVVAEVLKQSAG